MKNWEDLPSIITPNELKDVLGIGIVNAQKIYHKKDFPRIRGTSRLIADKDAVRGWCMGIDTEEIAKQVFLKEVNK